MNIIPNARNFATLGRFQTVWGAQAGTQSAAIACCNPIDQSDDSFVKCTKYRMHVSYNLLGESFAQSLGDASVRVSEVNSKTKNKIRS